MNIQTIQIYSYLPAVILFTLATVVEPLAVTGQDKVEPDANASATVQVEGTIELAPDPESENGIFRGRTALGKLPAGQSVQINLTLRNTHSETLWFSDVSKRCACSQFKPSTNSIPAGEEITATLTIKVPSRNNKPDVINRVKLVRVDKTVAELELEYELAGLLAFEMPFERISIKNPGGSDSVEIPLVVTHPVDISRVTVRTSENMEKLKTEIKPAGGGGVLKLTASAAMLADGDLRGNVFVVDPESGQEDQLMLVIRDRRPFEISPDLIIFKSRSDNNYSASSVIRFTMPISKLKDGDKSQKPKIKCTVGGHPLELTTKQLSQKVLKLELTIPESLIGELAGEGNDDAGNGQLVWEVFVPGQKPVSCRTRYLLSESPVEDGKSD